MTETMTRADGQPAIPGANSPAPIRGANKPQTLEEARQTITEQESGLHRIPVSLGSLSTEPGRLITGEVALDLDPAGLRRLCQLLRAPADYLAELPGRLRTDLLQHHFRAEGGRGPAGARGPYVLISRENRFVNLARADLYDLSGSDVLQAVAEGVGDAASLQVENLSTNGNAFTLDVVSPRVAREVRPGDVICGGIHVEHSLIAERATTILPYVLRLVCRNGLTRRVCLGRGDGARSTPRTRRLSRPQADAHRLQCDQVVRLASAAALVLQETLEAVGQLRDKPIKSVEDVLTQFLRQARLGSRHMLAVLRQAWAEEGAEPTAFGMLNAMTRAATHTVTVRQDGRDIVLSEPQRRALSRLAGVYAYQQRHICEHCFSVLRH